MYKLGKRVISQFIRTGCRRRLRLDLYQGVQARCAADVPKKDAHRPGLALLTQQGKDYERAKFRELEDIFPDLVVRGVLRPFQTEEDRAFDPPAGRPRGRDFGRAWSDVKDRVAQGAGARFGGWPLTGGRAG